MSIGNVRVVRDGPITLVGINRPQVRNAVDGPTAQELAAAFRSFDTDPESTVAVLYGVGEHFCAGADLGAIGTPRGNRVGRDGDGPMGPTRMTLSKPVIAAVEGYAVAGGLELAAWADLRVAAQTAVFGVFCRRFGVPLIDGGTVRLPRLIGRSRAMDLVLTGRPVGAAEASDIGLVNRVAEQGCALTEAIELARELSHFPQTCMRQDRLSLIEQEGMSETNGLANEFERGTESLRSDTIAGAARFTAGDGRHGQSVHPQRDLPSQHHTTRTTEDHQ